MSQSLEDVPDEEKPSTADVKSVVRSVRGGVVDTDDMCSTISQKATKKLVGMYPFLEDEPICVQGHIGSSPVSHWFLVFQPRHLQNASGTLVVDGSLDQFCDENPNKSFSLGPRESIPNVYVGSKVYSGVSETGTFSVEWPSSGLI